MALFLALALTSALAAPPLSVRSINFGEERPIPTKHTCNADNTSPSIQWSPGPARTQSYALIVEDPDAPKQPFIHWVLFNLPASRTSLAEGSSYGTAGENDFGSRGYSGPCPPSGAGHHYHFHVYAVDTVLPGLGADTSAAQLRAALAGHVLAEGELIGIFQR